MREALIGSALGVAAAGGIVWALSDYIEWALVWTLIFSAFGGL